MEVKTFYDDDHNLLMRLKDGDIVETEPPDGGWYLLHPSSELVEVFARFAQRLLNRKDGKPDAPITEFSEHATFIAEAFLWQVCDKLIGDTYGGDAEFGMSFADVVAFRLEDFAAWLDD